MKKCPFCLEDIQDEAIACKHCHRDLSVHAAASSVNRFIQEVIDGSSTATIVIALLLICSGPAFLQHPQGQPLSELALAVAVGASAIGLFLVLPVRIGNVVFRFFLAILLGFVLAIAVAVITK